MQQSAGLRGETAGSAVCSTRRRAF